MANKDFFKKTYISCQICDILYIQRVVLTNVKPNASALRFFISHGMDVGAQPQKTAAGPGGSPQKREVKGMYQIGELIAYGKTGVCRVEDVTLRAAVGGEKQQYYVLRPLYEECMISLPVASKKVSIRPILTSEQADALIDRIPELRQEADHSRVLRELEAHYVAALDSHDCDQLVGLTSSIYAKQQEAIGRNRRLGAVDERFFKKGEALLFGELAAALGISRDDVPDYITRRLAKRGDAAAAAGSPAL